MLAVQKYKRLLKFKTIDLILKNDAAEAKLGDFWFEEDKIILALNLYENIERPEGYAK